MTDRTGSRLIRRAALVSLGSTVLVVAFKLVAAAFTHSIAVLAEGLQSLLDVFMSLLVVWSLKIADEPPDEDHPYGHGKAELLTSAFQMVLVLFSAAIIVWQASVRLFEPSEIHPFWGIVAISYSIVANIAVFTYIRFVLRRHKSDVLQGEKAHLLSDTLASAGVLAGLLVYQAIGWAPLDPLIAIVFTLVGAAFAFRQLKKVVHPLMDGALPEREVAKIEKILNDHPEVRGYHRVQTRESGRERFVDIHVLLDDDLAFVRAHELAEHIEDHLSAALGGARVTLHYEPAEAEFEHREREHDEPRPI
jgi:cation diffusion facilitator family transporter